MVKSAKVTSPVSVQVEVFNQISPSLLPIIHDFCSAYKIPRHEIMDYLVGEGLRKFIKSDYGLVEELNDYLSISKKQSCNQFQDALEERLGKNVVLNWNSQALLKREF